MNRGVPVGREDELGVFCWPWMLDWVIVIGVVSGSDFVVDVAVLLVDVHSLEAKEDGVG